MPKQQQQQKHINKMLIYKCTVTHVFIYILYFMPYNFSPRSFPVLFIFLCPAIEFALSCLNLRPLKIMSLNYFIRMQGGNIYWPFGMQVAKNTKTSAKRGEKSAKRWPLASKLIVTISAIIVSNLKKFRHFAMEKQWGRVKLQTANNSLCDPS